MTKQNTVYRVVPFPPVRQFIVDSERFAHPKHSHCLFGASKEIHAYRNWRNQLVIFKSVDVLTYIEFYRVMSRNPRQENNVTSGQA